MTHFQLLIFHTFHHKFYNKCHASISISKVSERLKQSVALSGLIAYYHKAITASCWKPWWLLIFFCFFFFLVVCQRRHQRSRGLLGMAASWEHISECYYSWSLSLSSLWSFLLSVQPRLPFSDPFKDAHQHASLLFLTTAQAIFLEDRAPSNHKKDCFCYFALWDTNAVTPN